MYSKNEIIILGKITAVKDLINYGLIAQPYVLPSQGIQVVIQMIKI